jgi:heat shock protein HslJ
MVRWLSRVLLGWTILGAILVAQNLPTVGGKAGPMTKSALPPEILGVTWKWTKLITPAEQVAPKAPERYTLTMHPDGHAAVRADCNSGSGPYAASGDRQITIGPLKVTRRMCFDAPMDSRFVEALGRATTWSLREGRLYLEQPAGAGTLEFWK